MLICQNRFSSQTVTGFSLVFFAKKKRLFDNFDTVPLRRLTSIFTEGCLERLSRDPVIAPALKGSAVVCEARFRQKEYLPILTYNPVLQTSLSVPHREAAGPSRGSWHRGVWQLTGACDSFGYDRKKSWQLVLPFTARNAAQVCCEMPRCQVTPPRLELGPAASVLSIRSALLSDVCLSEQLPPRGSRTKIF